MLHATYIKLVWLPLVLCMATTSLGKGTVMMHDGIFREYDIRGKVGTELVIDQVYDLGKALGYYFVSRNPDLKKVAVGMDGRNHSVAIKEQLVRALTDSGLDVEFIGTCPTPAMYFAMHTTHAQAGIMITASHNPKEYNGMKICLGTECVWGKQLQEIKQLYKQKKSLPAGHGAYHEKLVIPFYIQWLQDHFKHLKGMTLSAVVDCGNGAAGTVMPELIKTMQWPNVQLLYGEVDGNYPNHEADPTVEKNMLEVKRLLATTAISIGLGLDGDCDRMDPMTKTGFLVPGDQLLALFAHTIAKTHPGAAIVSDIKSSAALHEILQKLALKSVISPSGHSIIKDQMKQHHALLGGELSCHFFFNDRYFGYDDGIYAMMRLFELLLDTQKTLDELLTVIPKKWSSPEYRIACADDKKNTVVQAVTHTMSHRPNVTAVTIDGIRATMPYGWGLVRVSNTQPALTIRFESDSQQGLSQIKHDFYDALKPFFDASWLAQQLEL